MEVLDIDYYIMLGLCCLLFIIGMIFILLGFSLFVFALFIEIDHLDRKNMNLPPRGVKKKSSVDNMTFKPLNGPTKSKEKLI